MKKKNVGSFATVKLQAKKLRLLAIALVAVIGFSFAACGGGGGDVLPAPTGLTATATSSTRIDLSWNAVPGAVEYNIYQNESLSSGFRLLGTETTNATFVYNLSPDTTYYYRVAAVAADGTEGAMSSIASATTRSAGSTPNYSLDGIWWSSSGEQITVSGSTGILTSFGNLSLLGTDAKNKGYYKLGDQGWRNLTSAGNLTWSGQVLHITYYTSSPNVATGTTWTACTITMSADSETITFASTTSSGDYTKTYTRTYTPPTPIDTLNGVWWSSSGEQITVSGSTGIIDSFGSLSLLGTDAVNKGYFTLGGTQWQNLTNTGTLTWSGQTKHITYNESSPNVATGIRWRECTITMSADGQTITFASADSGGPYSYTYTRTYIPPAPSVSLDGVWTETGGSGRVVTISGSAGTLNSVSDTRPIILDAISKGYWGLGSTHWRNLSSTGNLTWSGQWVAFTYNTSNPNVATGTSWISGTWTLSADGETLTVGNADGSSTWTKGSTPPSPTYSLEGIWEGVGNGGQITVSGTGGVRTRWSTTTPEPIHIDARNKGYSALGQQVWRYLTSTGTLTWSGQVLHISFYTSNPDVAVGTQWTDCTITMSADAKTIVFSSADYNGPYSFTYTRNLTSGNPGDDGTGTPGLAFTSISSNTAYSVSIGTANAAAIVIPYLYDGKPVTAIAANGFQNSSIMSIEIPGSITVIGASAFAGCTNLRSVTIPISVTSIGQYAFQNCSGMESISIPFVGNTLNGTSNTHFGYIFGASSYSNNGTAIPPSLRTVVITGGNSIANNAFRNCGGLETITISDSVTTIGTNAFDGCRSLTDITIPDSVTRIDNYAFNGCSVLVSIIIPDNVTIIGTYVFQNCNSLESVTIGNKVTTIGNYAFNGCSVLASIIIPNNVTSLGTYAFQNCNALESVTISNRVSSIGNYTFNGCRALTGVIIPDGVTGILGSAFQNCTSLSYIVIPSSVNNIGYNAFSGCTGLTSVYYGGADAAAWSGITLGNSTSPLTSATRYYASQWRLVGGEPTLW